MKTNFPAIFGLAFLTACSNPPQKQTTDSSAQNADTLTTAANEDVALPQPYATDTVSNNSKTVDWPEGKMPLVPAGFTIKKYAADFDSPRWMYQGPNGDIFVAETATRGSKANRITVLRDANKDGKPEIRKVFLENLNQPFGMLVLQDKFYVANTDGISTYPYTTGSLNIDPAKAKKIKDLPAGGYNNHWTRNLLASNDGRKIYVTVGSGSNVAEHGMENEKRRANILEINPDGSGEVIYASGLRNPVGLDWAPGTNTLWTAVNERDNLGDELVPDYTTSVKKGAFYGWPFSYFGQHEDPRLKGKNPELVKKTIVPDVPLGSHTASLGLSFYDKDKFPERYRGGLFIGQHGSWNRSSLSGYKVVFIPFKNGKPAGKAQDFLTGFIADEKKSEVYGRPVGVLTLADGSLLVADDASNTLWQVSATR